MSDTSRSISVSATRAVARPDAQGAPPSARKRYAREGLTVDSTLELGIDPRLHLQWSIPKRLADGNNTLLIFRRFGGLAAIDNPRDLSAHGDLLLETVHDGSREERLPEGTYGFTFLIIRAVFLGCFAKDILVRFTETVPSAKVPIGRLKDRGELQDLLAIDDLRPLEHEIRRGETELRLKDVRERLNPVEKDLAAKEEVKQPPRDEVEDLINSYYHRKETIERLKNDPKFQKLSKTERNELLGRLNATLDPGEASARR